MPSDRPLHIAGLTQAMDAEVRQNQRPGIPLSLRHDVHNSVRCKNDTSGFRRPGTTGHCLRLFPPVIPTVTLSLGNGPRTATARRAAVWAEAARIIDYLRYLYS